MSFTRKNLLPLRDEIAADIRRAILARELTSGSRIFEGQVAEQMGVSRVPVREALALLEQEGLVVRKPNRGVFVASLSAEEFSELFTLRAALEEFAIERAQRWATDEEFTQLEEWFVRLQDALERGDAVAAFEADMSFHRQLVLAAHHRLLLEHWDQIINMLRLQLQNDTLLRGLYVPCEPLIERHRVLLEAARSQDAEQARQIVRDHVVRSGTVLLVEAQRCGLLLGAVGE